MASVGAYAGLFGHFAPSRHVGIQHAKQLRLRIANRFYTGIQQALFDLGLIDRTQIRSPMLADHEHVLLRGEPRCTGVTPCNIHDLDDIRQGL